MRFLVRFVVTGAGILVAIGLIPGIQADSVASTFLAVVALTLLNSIVRPVILLLSIPWIIVTLGLIVVVINALLLKLASVLVPGFQVEGVWSAFFGAILISLISFVVNLFFIGKKLRLTFTARVGPSQSPPRPRRLP